jgi:hypothetical protein
LRRLSNVRLATCHSGNQVNFTVQIRCQRLVADFSGRFVLKAISHLLERSGLIDELLPKINALTRELFDFVQCIHI